MKKKSNALGIAGFVISLCSVVLMAVPVLPGIVASFGAVLALLGIVRAGKRNQGIGLAIAGLVIGAFFALIGFVPTSDTPAEPSVQPTESQQVIQTVTPEPTASLVPTVTPEPEPVETPTPTPVVTPEPTPEPEPVETPEPAETTPPPVDPAAEEAEYRASCQALDYKAICRYPDEYTGEHLTVEVKIYQIMDVGGWFSEQAAWQAFSDTSGYGFYADDEYYLLDYRDEGAVKVLEDDVIRIYGTYAGTRTVTRALTRQEVEVPCIRVLYLDLIED